VVVALIVGALAWAIGCNALSGVDDLVPVEYSSHDGGRDVTAPRDAPPPPPPPDGHVHDFDAALGGDSALQPLPDAGVVDANAGLCEGLTMLLRLDGTTTSAQGAIPLAATGVQFVPGKFGQALIASTTQVDYDSKAGTIASPSRGTVSMWIDSQWELPCDATRTFFGVDDNGVYMECEKPGYLGLWVDIDPDTSVAAEITPASGVSVWSNGWNHLVATWSSSPPSLTITLNGAVGQATTAPWTPPDTVPTVFHLLDSDFPALANIDDVALWTRPLSPAEIQTIFLAGTSVGDVCKLP